MINIEEKIPVLNVLTMSAADYTEAKGIISGW
jgi:hypothetical protein